MTTRLDRLLLLLSTGSTPIVRQTAAKQLGSIAAQRIARPSTSNASSAIYHGLDGEWNEIINLLVKVLPFLRSKQWETRSAAALAVECIVKAAGVWDPLAFHEEDADQDNYSNEPSAVLRDFNLTQVILQGKQLLASSGNEYAGGPSGTSGKQDLVKSLGLSVPGAGDDELGIDVDEELREGALQSNGSNDIKGKGKMTAATPTPAAAPKQEDEDLSHLSARERNAIKRKRKQASQGTSPVPGPPAKMRKVDSPLPSASTSRSDTPNQSPAVKKEEDAEGPQSVTIAYKGPKIGQAAVKESDEEQATWIALPNEWPFKQIVASLREGLLHTEWEIRHGAALGLREIFKVQGRAGGTNVDLSLQQNQLRHQERADTLAVDLLTVLALDRFGDFVGDQVMAPVRETASQTLSALLVHMPQSSVLRVLDLLSTMVRQDEVKAELETKAQMDPESRKGKRNYYWEVKHAGLLGLKYLVAVRRDLFEKQEEVKQESSANGTSIPVNGLPDRQKRVENILDTSILGLSDKDDDVRSVAASVLLPLANLVVDSLAREKTLLLLDMLYLSLGDLRDDLSSSVGNVMDLLSKLLQFPTILEQMQSSGESRSLIVLIPKLFPFFRHTITGVRKAVVDAIYTFLTLPALASDTTSDWIDGRLLRMLYQNLIVEQNGDIRETSLAAWTAAITRFSSASQASTLVTRIQPLLPSWFDILMTPIGQQLNTTSFWKPSEYDPNATGVYSIDKAMVKQDLALVSVEQILQGRLAAVEALADALSRYPPDLHEANIGPLLGAYMTSASSHQLSFSSIFIARWAESLAAQSPPAHSPLLDHLAPLTLKALASDPAISYSETVGLLTQIHTHCQQLLGIFKNKGKIPANHLPVLDPPHQGFSLARAQQLAGIDFQALLNIMPPKAKPAAQPLLQELANRIQSETMRTAALKEAMDVQVFASIAGAVVALKQIPTKLNPLIRSLMNGIKFEANSDLQKRTATALASFISLCNEAGAAMKSNPSDKIVKNVCSFLCQDATMTPLFTMFKTTTKGIITPRDVGGIEQNGAAVVPTSKVAALGVAAVSDEVEDEANRKTKLVRRGAEYCLQALASEFGSTLFEQVPRLWMGAAQSLATMTAEGLDALEHHCTHNETAAQELLDSLTVLDALCAAAPSVVLPRLMEVLPKVIISIQSKFAVVRYVAVRCLVTICDSFAQEAMKSVVLEVIPFIADPSSTARRRGATELIAGIIDRLDIRILPYITFLVVPVLGRMTDSDEETRVLATRTFASLVKLVPLEADIPDPQGFPKDLLQKRDEERKFLLQLLGGGKVEDYELHIKVSVDLRRYQRDGVNWLAFLARYQLHGILCDDMGLGKTLQTICILGSKIKERAEVYAASKSPSAVHLPSLVVCPPTLVGHWKHEIQTYVPELSCTIYGGDRQERIKRASGLKSFDIVITSYDVVRNDIEVLQPIDWNYCVLDEGHIIKNGKTKLSRAIKTIRANHRLILSGTPIQNNVLELWNLFDFLMPGFLGTEEAFNRRYGKPIQQSRDAKSSSKDQEAGALALEALHKQVLPFILRRLKEDVLDDLPPKIIQDYYCDLSPLQRDLYENFTKASEDEQDTFVSKVEDDEEAKPAKAASSGGGQSTHVFQTLQYLRRLVNHPTLVIQPDRPDHQRILAKHGLSGNTGSGNVQDIAQAPKLMALKQLLLDSGIGTQSVKAESNGSADIDLNSDSAVAPHRVLIFCQLKSMLDLIENSLFAKHLPSVSYMRLDGSTPPHKRHSVVQTFNADPSIDVLLLTTHVGGLGLNLTGADTVIFVEHDWNPMRDLQAMDRAHRLGQKRVVNVYRLITKGTLEEKIMGLQRFKMNIASTVVSQQNADLATMDTENVLDLFSGQDDGGSSAGGGGKQKKDGKLTQKEILQNLQELDDNSDEYRDMGDATSFADSLAA